MKQDGTIITLESVYAQLNALASKVAIYTSTTPISFAPNRAAGDSLNLEFITPQLNALASLIAQAYGISQTVFPFNAAYGQAVDAYQLNKTIAILNQSLLVGAAPSTTFFTSAQAQAVMVGLKNTVSNAARIYGYAGGETLFVFRVQGTSAVMHLWSDFNDDGTLCSVSVDGGAYVNVVASSGDSHTIFTGLPNTTHIVLVKYGPAYGNSPYILSSGTVLELTGAPPALNTPVAWLDTFNTANVIGSALKVTGQTNYLPAQMPGTVTTLMTRPSFMFNSSTSYLDIISGSKYVFVSIDGASPTRYDLGASLNPNSYMGYLRVPTSGTHRYNVWRDLGASANVYTHLYVGVDSAPSTISAGRMEQWGDSITFGQGSSNVGEVEVYRVGSALGYTGQAYGISGLQTAGLDANLTTQLPAKVSVPANDVCIIAIGRNDIGSAFSVVSANYSSIISKVLPYYKKVLCRGVWPDSSGPYTAWNAGLAALVTSLANPKVVYIDPATWTGVNTVDGTHPSDSGYTTLAGYAQTAYTPYV